MARKLKIVLSSVVLIVLLSSLLMFSACSKTTKYLLRSATLGSYDLSNAYEYNYIEFNEKDKTYKLENKDKTYGITSKQTGSYLIDNEGKITITNNEIPSKAYLLCDGEEIYLIGNTLTIKGYIDTLGYCEMIFSKK